MAKIEKLRELIADVSLKNEIKTQIQLREREDKIFQLEKEIEEEANNEKEKYQELQQSIREMNDEFEAAKAKLK